MSMKSVEMQIAIPRTNDVKMVQNQLLHKPMMDQAALAAGSQQQAEELRQKTGQVEAAVSKRVKGDSGEQREKNQAKAQSRAGKTYKKQAEEHVDHPFKGHHIDLSL